MDSREWRRVLGERTYMTEADVGTERDVPCPWVIVIPEMSIKQARELGRAIGQARDSDGNRFPAGRFISGTVGENLAKYAKLRQEIQEREREGGDGDGQEG